MKRKWEFVLIVCLAIASCSAVSHLAVGWLKIKATWGGHKHYGPKDLNVTAILDSSSPGYDGIDWSRVSELLNGAIESCATPGSSPCEWEMLHNQPTNATHFFVGVSAYDLNEYFLCDFRADIVPLYQTIRDLRQSRANWQFSKRMLSQYPVMFIRKLFPTVGRSDGVLVGIRAKLSKLAGRSVDAGETPKFGAIGKSDIEEKVSDWTEARVQRRLNLLRASCQEKHSFNGPKKLALLRLLRRAEAQGKVVLVVLPLPPAYRQPLLAPSAVQEFEEALANVQRHCPRVEIVRLDQLPTLNHNQYYYDLVHLNMYGQQIATEAFLGRLKELSVGR